MLKHQLEVIENYIKYWFLPNTIRVYFWKEHANFGDLITPALLKYYGFRPVCFYPNRAQLVSTGSLIEHLSPNFNGIILGTGAISAAQTKFPKANVLGLRGKYTQKLLGIEDDIVLGDPGLLSSKLLNERRPKKYKLGIVPHYADHGNILVTQIVNRYPDQISVINVCQQPVTVLKAIDECECILSSSLHGLICADSLGLPNQWIKLSDLLGGNFKFFDYYSVFDIEASPYFLSGKETLNELIGLTRCVPKEKIEYVRDRLDKTFKGLKQLL